MKVGTPSPNTRARIHTRLDVPCLTLPYLPACNQDALTVADFYSNPGAKEMYKLHIAAMTSRVNVFSGQSYRCVPAGGRPKEPACGSDPPAGLMRRSLIRARGSSQRAGV